jgi:hypothetical protein
MMQKPRGVIPYSRFEIRDLISEVRDSKSSILITKWDENHRLHRNETMYSYHTLT